jgi:hypothetical protein
LEETDIGEYVEINCGKSQSENGRPLVLMAKI